MAAYETRKRVVSRRRIAGAFGLFTSLCLRNRDSRGSLGLVGRGLLREASPHQNLDGVVVTLAAGVLPQRPWDRAQGNDRRPGFRPCRRIVNREFVLDRFRVYAREVFGNFQGRGIGTHILRDVIESSIARGVPVRLRTQIVNHAANLYRRMGFHETDRTKSHLVLEWN